MIISAYLDEVSCFYLYLYVWSIFSGGLKLPPRIDIYLVNRSHSRALRWHRGLKWSDVCFFGWMLFVYVNETAWQAILQH